MLDKKNLFNNEESAILVGVVKKDETDQQVLDLGPVGFIAQIDTKLLTDGGQQVPSRHAADFANPDFQLVLQSCLFGL